MEDATAKHKPVYHVIAPELLFNQEWIQIPVKPVIRNKKTVPSYSYSYGNQGPKFVNQNSVPRLFWFPKSANLFDIMKEIITQYSFV